MSSVDILVLALLGADDISIPDILRRCVSPELTLATEESVRCTRW